MVTIIPIVVWFILLCLPFFQNWKSDEAIVTIRRASLSDLSCLDDVDLLSVRQLKEILARNFVNFTGCCEKWELMERVRRLYLEQQRLQGENKNVMKRYTTKEASSHSFKNCVLNNYATSSFWYSFKSALKSYLKSLILVFQLRMLLKFQVSSCFLTHILTCKTVMIIF